MTVTLYQGTYAPINHRNYNSSLKLRMARLKLGRHETFGSVFVWVCILGFFFVVLGGWSFCLFVLHYDEYHNHNCYLQHVMRMRMA